MTIQVGGSAATTPQKNQILDDLGAVRNVAGMTTAFNAGTTAEKSAFRTAVAGDGISAGDSAAYLPLTHSLLAEVGEPLTYTRVGAGYTVDHVGSVRVCDRSNDAPFVGARRVVNADTVDDFSTIYTVASGTVKALHTSMTGPYRNRKNVYMFTRSASGELFRRNTANVQTGRKGQYTWSAWLGGNGVATLTVQIQNAASTVLATKTVTPPASGLRRFAIFAELPSNSDTYRVVVTTSAAGVFRAACPQFERTHGQSGAPNDYVPRGSTYDAAPYYGANVDGVRYFDDLNPWTVDSDGWCTEATVRVPIPRDTLKGLLIADTWVNKMYESADAAAASWTRTGVTAASAMLGSVHLGPQSLRKLEEDTSTGQHRISQSWRGTLPSSNVMVTVWCYVPLTPGERTILDIGFTDLAGAVKRTYVDVQRQVMLSETGSGNQKTHIVPMGDLLCVGYTDTSGSGSTTPTVWYGLATAAGTDSYTGTAGSGMYVGGMSAGRVDHPHIYQGDTGTSTPSGQGAAVTAYTWPEECGDNAVTVTAADGSTVTSVNDWTVVCDVSPAWDSDSQAKTSWDYIWYMSMPAAQIPADHAWRHGCAIRPGAFGGAVVEDYVKNPVYDCYVGSDGGPIRQINPNTGLSQERFGVINALHITPAWTTVRWQIACHPQAIDNGSNLTGMVGSTIMPLDSNGQLMVHKTPTGAVFRLGYKGTPISEKAIKGLRMIKGARTAAEMLAAAA